MTSNNKATAQVSPGYRRSVGVLGQVIHSSEKHWEGFGTILPSPASLQLQLIYIRKFNSFPDLFWEEYIDLLHCSVLLLRDKWGEKSSRIYLDPCMVWHVPSLAGQQSVPFSSGARGCYRHNQGLNPLGSAASAFVLPGFPCALYSSPFLWFFTQYLDNASGVSRLIKMLCSSFIQADNETKEQSPPSSYPISVQWTPET